MNWSTGSRRTELAAKAAIATLLLGSLVPAVAAVPPPVTAERTADGSLRIRSTGNAPATRRGAEKPATAATRDRQVRTTTPPRTPEEMRRRLLERRKQIEKQAASPAATRKAGNTPPPASGLDAPADPVFRVFSWQEPRGSATTMDTVQAFVRVKVDTVPTPEDVADRVVDQILARNLEHEQIAVLLQNFGMGDGDSLINGWPLPPAPALFWHWCDGLEHAEPRGTPDQHACQRIGNADATPNWWRTPWMSHGIAESRLWMDRFIARYKHRQATDERIPDPSRFHFDSEYHTTSRRIWSPREFHAMKSDPRWDTEPIPGFEGRPMSKLYEDAGSPVVDPTQRSYRSPNLAWRDWYEGICIQAADAAMDLAAYQPIREAWPAAKSSNWRTSDAYDGIDGRFRFANNGTMRSVNRAYGDIQAPVIYAKSPAFQVDPEARRELMQSISERFEYVMHSFGGPHTNLAPWTYVPGTPVTVNGKEHRSQEDLLRHIIAMIRARGVHEILLWSTSHTQVGTRWWDDATDAIRDATAFTIRGARVDQGTAGPARDVFERIRYRHRDAITIESAPKDQMHRAVVRARFEHRDSIFQSGDAIMAHLFATTEQPEVRARVSIRNWHTGREIWTGTRVLEKESGSQDADRVLEFEHASDPAMLDRNGTLEVLLHFESSMPFTVAVDNLFIFITDSQDGSIN